MVLQLTQQVSSISDRKCNRTKLLEGEKLKSALARIIQSENLNEYQLFKDFCLYKEKGLRKESFKSLNSFLKEATEWNTNKQQDFVFWIFEIFETSENIHQVLVHPLEEALMKPLLEKWMDRNPKDPRPYRWYGLFLNSDKRTTYLKIALEKGGNGEQQVLLKMIEISMNSLWYSFHHISEDLYLGDIEEDKELIEEIKNLNIKVENEEYKISNYQDIVYYKNLLNDWITYKNDGSEGFVQWCADNGKEYEFTKTYYYD